MRRSSNDADVDDNQAPVRADARQRLETVGSAVMAAITRDEWVARYAAQIRRRVGWPEQAAKEAAEAGAKIYEDWEEVCGEVAVWWGDKTDPGNTPEAEADDELEYWD